MATEHQEEKANSSGGATVNQQRYREYSVCEPKWQRSTQIYLREDVADLRPNEFGFMIDSLAFYIAKDRRLHRTDGYCFVEFSIVNRDILGNKTSTYCVNVPYNSKRSEYIGGFKFDRDSLAAYKRSWGLFGEKKDSASFFIDFPTSAIEKAYVFTETRYQTETMFFVCQLLGIKIKRELF